MRKSLTTLSRWASWTVRTMTLCARLRFLYKGIRRISLSSERTGARKHETAQRSVSKQELNFLCLRLSKGTLTNDIVQIGPAFDDLGWLEVQYCLKQVGVGLRRTGCLRVNANLFLACESVGFRNLPTAYTLGRRPPALQDSVCPLSFFGGPKDVDQLLNSLALLPYLFG